MFLRRVFACVQPDDSLTFSIPVPPPLRELQHHRGQAGWGHESDLLKSCKVNIMLFPGQPHLRLSDSWTEASPVDGPCQGPLRHPAINNPLYTAFWEGIARRWGWGGRTGYLTHFARWNQTFPRYSTQHIFANFCLSGCFFVYPSVDILLQP